MSGFPRAASPVGSASGDLSGSFPSPVVAQIQGHPISSAQAALVALGTVPGTLLASQVNPAASTYSLNLGTLTALDTTNATLAFVVPASTNVDIDVEFFWQLGATAATSVITVGLLDHTSHSQVGKSIPIANSNTTLADSGFARIRFRLAGVYAAGAQQIDIAAAVTNTAAAAANIVNTAGATGLLAAGVGMSMLIQAFAA